MMRKNSLKQFLVRSNFSSEIENLHDVDVNLLIEKLIAKMSKNIIGITMSPRIYRQWDSKLIQRSKIPI